MALDNIIFTFDHVRKVGCISDNIKPDEFEIYAREIQIDYLRPLIGDALYLALLNDPGETRFVNLLNGVVYQKDGIETIFYGLNRYLSYLWLWKYSLGSSLNLTPSGPKEYLSELTTDATQKPLGRDAIEHFRVVADREEGKILDYLKTKKKDNGYHEFPESRQIEKIKNDSTFYVYSNGRWK